jgi:chromosome segregation ATPase
MTEQNEVQAATEAAADEFETAFAEFSKARDTDDTEAAAEAAEGADENTRTLEATEAAQEPAAQEDDVAQKLADAEKRAKDLEQRLKSDLGRQSALQRKVQELQAQLEAGPKTQKSEREHSAKMKQLMADFPEIAEAVQEEMDARLSAVKNEFQSVVTPIKAREQEQELVVAEQRVKEIYPEFVATVNSPEFVEWYRKQPAAVQSLAGSKDPQDAIAMLDYFTGGKRGVPQADPKIQEIKDRRDAALQRNVTVRNTSAPPVTDAPDDFDTAFQFFAKKRERERAGRY